MTAGAGNLAGELAAYVDSQSTLALPLIAVEVDAGDARPTLRGRVLTQAQKAAVGKIARSHGARVDLEVIAEPESGLEQGWLAITEPAIEVWRDPHRIGEDHARQTEYLAGDGDLRLLGRLPGAFLVQGPDLTVGWVDPAGLQATDGAGSLADWERRVRAQRNAIVATDPRYQLRGGDSVSLLAAVAREALGVPYRWGGTTAMGYDCSGLVQRVFATTTGVLLPKHTGDQRRVGERVVRGRPGDLLFATPRNQKVGHVMLVTTPTKVLHACRTEGRVIEEPIAVNAKRYRHQGYRRPVQLRR